MDLKESKSKTRDIRKGQVNQKIRNARGAYVLYIKIHKDCKIKIGALGEFNFLKGIYVYIGSAMGAHSTSLNKRISRHVRTALSPIGSSTPKNNESKKSPNLKKTTKTRWHIDYLLQDLNTSIIKIAIIPSTYKIECEISQIYQELIEEKDSKIFFCPKFGASDCKLCPSHLFKLH